MDITIERKTMLGKIGRLRSKKQRAWDAIIQLGIEATNAEEISTESVHNWNDALEKWNAYSRAIDTAWSIEQADVYEFNELTLK